MNITKLMKEIIDATTKRIVAANKSMDQIHLINDIATVRLNLGRQVGHTTAICDLIANSNINIAYVADTQKCLDRMIKEKLANEPCWEFLGLNPSKLCSYPLDILFLHDVIFIDAVSKAHCTKIIKHLQQPRNNDDIIIPPVIMLVDCY
jgi:hypothetical protein